MCHCDEFSPLAVRKDDIAARVAETPGIVAGLERAAASVAHGAELFVCPGCDAHWQTGKHPLFGSAAYVFQVPRIAVEAWLSEPYVQPAALFAFAEAKRWLARTGQIGIRPRLPEGRMFFLPPRDAPHERAPVTAPRRSSGRVKVAARSNEAPAQSRHPEHLESQRAVS